MDVVLHYHNSRNDAERLCAELNTQREDSAHSIAGDLSAPSTPESLIRQALEWHPRLKVLVNNAAVFYPTPMDELNVADWDNTMAVNLRAPLLLCTAFAARVQPPASIINIADIHGQNPLPRHAAYSASQAALIMLTRSLAVELAPGCRVNAIAPGAISWPERGVTDTEKQQILEKVVLRRLGSCEDIAKAVEYLVGADYVVGQTLVVDGGRSLFA